MRLWTKPILPIVAAMLVLTGCGPNTISAGSQRAKTPTGINDQRMLVLPRPPQIAAKNPDEIEVAKRLLSRLTPEELSDRDGARIVDANALPWLSGSTKGRAFLAKKPQRVLVRGHPAALCPIAVVMSAPVSEPMEQVAGEALAQCLSETQRSDCGCRVVAAGSVLLVPREDVNYATGIAARVRAPSLGIDGLLVAEETVSGTILLRDLSGTIGTITRTDDEKVTLTLNGSPSIFTGTARKVGFRRGRLAERIYARDGSGQKISVLIGFDPDELADVAGAWLAFPPDA